MAEARDSTTRDESAPADGTVRTVRVGDVALAALTLEQCADLLVRRARRRIGGLVLTHNLEHLRQYRAMPEFRRATDTASLCVADGMPLVWASRLQGDPLPGRVNGTDLLLRMLELLATTDLSVYFAGGLDDTAERVAAVASDWYPRLKIAGAHSPPAGLSGSDDHLRETVDRILLADPDVVFIGLPSHLQAAIGVELADRLPHVTAVGVGVSFSFLTGDLQRAPRWMQRCGLEWLHRMVHQPAALGRRYLLRCGPLGLALLASAARTGAAVRLRRVAGLLRRG
jgi:N-acetylglucosaminyldiphosphoundecaprenol N-acetyl-beta-D-mannosaminyltransferase